MSLYTFAFRPAPEFQWTYPSMKLHSLPVSVVQGDDNPQGVIFHARKLLTRAGVPIENVPHIVVDWQQYLLGANINRVVALWHPEDGHLLGQYMIVELEVPATGLRTSHQIGVNDAPAALVPVISLTTT